jgi:hypothetical protein
VFGVAIEALVERESQYDSSGIPMVLRTLTDFLLSDGMVTIIWW